MGEEAEVTVKDREVGLCTVSWLAPARVGWPAGQEAALLCPSPPQPLTAREHGLAPLPCAGIRAPWGVEPGLTLRLFSPAAQYFASTMIIVGLSVVVTVIVLQYHHHDPDGGQMPKWVRSSRPPCSGSGALPKGGAMNG